MPLFAPVIFSLVESQRPLYQFLEGESGGITHPAVFGSDLEVGVSRSSLETH